MNVAQPMGAAARELPAVGVDRQFSIQCDPLAPFDEETALANRAKAQSFQPDHRKDRKSVV
ncbi:hypothetical protein D3C85_1399710 [compost metagenome]